MSSKTSASSKFETVVPDDVNTARAVTGRHVTFSRDSRSVTDMSRTCAACATEFDGRADARFCSAGCRQRAYRQRHRPHRPEPYTNTEPYDNPHVKDDGCCPWHKLIAAMNLRFYDPHSTADVWAFNLCAQRLRAADEIDQFIEWLSVVRDGFVGMETPERIAASIKRCT
ncbi:hypothetical protein ABGB19_02070 [Mycobacterium sp. B14F4]|uniref:hypothetical protein n=1 Tax=Mycobacterium sp. B14F4 TaxID=3153565 RepID=UPI00325DFCFA